MRNAIAIARKELGIYFTTPSAWMVLAAMAAVSSFFFLGMVEELKRVQELARQVGWARLGPQAAAYRNVTDGVVVQLWGVMTVMTIFVAPILSMRLFSEEHRQKTFEWLMTTPVRPSEIVLGKYLGAVGVMFATLGLTLVFPGVLWAFGSGQSGTAVEWTTVLLGFGAVLLWGATCVAIGLFISSLTESQALAAFVTFVVLLPWVLLRGLMPGAEEPLRSLVAYLSADVQLQPLIRGVLEVKTLVFFTSIITLSLFLTHRRVEAFRWA
jgi:ABC-2 type transport system permease protein